MTAEKTSDHPLLAEMRRRCAPPMAFGHLWYEEAPRAAMVMLANKQIMRVAAARAFLELCIAAKDSSVSLIPAWTHRTHQFQGNLFVSWATKERRSFEENLRHVAPAGFSEHHTGYAVDIHEGPGPGVIEKQPFQQTRAYAWLLQNAARFGFENSYPRDNVFGVRFEPWHWRWVGDDHARATFETSRALAAAFASDPRVAAVVQAPSLEQGLTRADLDGSLVSQLRTHVERLRQLSEPA